MIRADFSKTNHLFLSYPKGFANEYEALVPFYDQLIELMPYDIHLYVICNTKAVKGHLKHKFSHKKMDVVVARYWDEIWLRDCMGVFAGDTIYKFKYHPNYCTLGSESRYYDSINQLSRQILTETLTSTIVDVPLHLDAGNFVHNGQKVFLTSKVHEDNPWSDVEQIIKDHMGLEAIVVEKSPLDVIGHTDGYMAFKDAHTLFVSHYQKQSYLKKDIAYTNMLRSVAVKNGLRVLPVFDNPSDEHIKCACKKVETRSCLYSAKGLYINYIRFNDCIIMPEYTIGANSPLDYNMVNRKWLESQGFNVVGINCDGLAKFGGALHCISFQCWIGRLKKSPEF